MTRAQKEVLDQIAIDLVSIVGRLALLRAGGMSVDKQVDAICTVIKDFSDFKDL